MLQALANFPIGSMHRKNGCPLAQEYFQMAALRRFKRAALLFEPSLELGTCQIPRIQQACREVNTSVVSPSLLMTRLVARRSVGEEIFRESALVCRQQLAHTPGRRRFQN